MSREPATTQPRENLEEAAKPAATILRQEISSGTTQLERPTTGLFLSAVAAGLDLRFGPALMATVRAAAEGNGLAVRLALAGAHSIGHASIVGWLRFMAVATIGNALGGTIFVALVKFGHVRFAGPEFSRGWR